MASVATYKAKKLKPVKDHVPSQIGKRPAGRVLDHLLHHHVATARVEKPCFRGRHHPHRLAEGGRFALQNLLWLLNPSPESENTLPRRYRCIAALPSLYL